MDKKAISLIITNLMILIVVVTSVILFKYNFLSYLSQLYSSEDRSDIDLNILKLEENIVYIQSSSKNILNFFKIYDGNQNLICDLEYTGDDLLANLVAYWKANDNALDNTINTHDGTVTGSVTYYTGKSGNAFNFTSDSQYVTVPNNSDFNFNSTTSMSVSLWFNKPGNCDSSTGINPEYLFNRLETSSYWFGISCRDYQASIHPNEIAFFHEQPGEPRLELYSTTTVADGIWHHVVVVYDEIDNEFSLYLDSLLVDSNNTFTYTVDSDYPNAPICFGDWKSSIGCSGLYDYKGLLDEIRFYKRALSAQDISNLYINSNYNPNLIIGINEIDIEECSLNQGDVYNLIAFTNDQKIETTLLVD